MCIPYSLSPSLWHLHFHFVLSSISWIISIAKVSMVGLLCVSVVSLPPGCPPLQQKGAVVLEIWISHSPTERGKVESLYFVFQFVT